MSELYQVIYATIRKIPAGHVASYGQVAQAVGMHRGARIVGWALGSLRLPADVPWHRVVNKEGVLSIVNPTISKTQQKEMLESEGIAAIEQEGFFRILEPPWHSFETGGTESL